MNHVDLTKGPVWKHVLRMAPPMATAFFAMMAFNLADTWFVSLLGTGPLAAMGFTFPIVMLFHTISMGIGLGTSSCVSRAIGAQDHDRIRHLATCSMLLALVVTCVLAFLGFLLIPVLLAGLGAQGETLDLATQYLRIWFMFAPCAALPMVGNNAIRATGDTLRPAVIMSTAAIINIELDPLFIFGGGPVPALGVPGAALATGISRLVTVGWSLWLMHSKCRLLTFRWAGMRRVLAAWREVLHIAVPISATNLLMPITMGIVTRMIARFGETAVAATAAGQRIEQFTYLVPMAMGTALVPIIGQNWGAGRVDRVREAWVRTNWYGVAYASLCLILSVPLARPVAECFSRNPAVINLAAHYLQIMLTGGLMVHIMVHTGFAFNAIRKPMQASMLTVLRMVILVIPLAWLGSRLYGPRGIYGGIAAAGLLSGAVALFWFDKVTRRHLDGAGRSERRIGIVQEASPDAYMR